MTTNTKIVIAATAVAIATPATLALAFKLGRRNGRVEALSILRETLTNVVNQETPETN